MINVNKTYARLNGASVVAKALALSGAAALAPALVVLFALDSEAARMLALLSCLTSAGAIVALVITLRPVLDVAQQLSSRAGLVSDDARDSASQLKANVDAIVSKLEASAALRSHPVTGLPLREEFLRLVGKETARGASQGLLGLLRLANFDQILAFDSGAAQRMLSCVATRLSTAATAVRPIGHVDRDCFAIWFDADLASARAELQALAYVLGQEVRDLAFEMTPDIQIGQACYPIDADEIGDLLNRAFVSLAQPERMEGGALAFFARPEPGEARRRFSVEQDLRRAVRRGEFELNYQPFVDLAMGRVVGAEALLRWRSEAHAVLSAGQVVAVLEEAGLVHEVGLWTLNAACRQMRLWRDSAPKGFKIAVNVSAKQLQDMNFVSTVERTVVSHGLSPACIELELTESATMADVTHTHAIFERLREMGFSLAIDDFGSGYSSLTYLRRLPFQKLKIDREFVTHVDQRADSRTICQALIDLTAGLELAVLAEGVERFEEVEMLRTMGCSTFQGFYFSRPIAAEEFLPTITDPSWMARVCSRVHREQHELRRRLP